MRKQATPAAAKSSHGRRRRGAAAEAPAAVELRSFSRDAEALGGRDSAAPRSEGLANGASLEEGSLTNGSGSAGSSALARGAAASLSGASPSGEPGAATPSAGPLGRVPSPGLDPAAPGGVSLAKKSRKDSGLEAGPLALDAPSGGSLRWGSFMGSSGTFDMDVTSPRRSRRQP
jgi:hypothetical protein